MQYAPTYTDQKFDSHLLNESQTRQVLGRMQYAPTYTDQKFDSHLLDESQIRQVLGCMSLRLTPPGEKFLKFVWMHAKPGGDWMKMAISIENPAGIG